MTTQLKMFATGNDLEPETATVKSENIQPTPAEKSEQIAKIIEAFEHSRHHEYGVTMRRLMEICGERSARQRVFDAKQHYKAQGETLVYRKEPDSYFLVKLMKETT